MLKNAYSKASAKEQLFFGFAKFFVQKKCATDRLVKYFVKNLHN
jgi:hypothetical protein